ncbi:hypothetical protein D3C83_110410 [compost metagenome]
MRHGGQRAIEGEIVFGQRGARINERGRAMRGSDLREIDGLGMQPAVPVNERVHG